MNSFQSGPPKKLLMTCVLLITALPLFSSRVEAGCQFFRRSTTCALGGSSHSFWAGATSAEATACGWTGGQGYGNGWNIAISKTFAYAGAGNVTLGFNYRNDTENGHDFTDVLVVKSGATCPSKIAGFTGTSSGAFMVTLTSGAELPSAAGFITIYFLVLTDDQGSNEDNLYASSCGAFAVDDISLSGAIIDFSDFETGANGWSSVMCPGIDCDHENVDVTCPGGALLGTPSSVVGGAGKYITWNLGADCEASCGPGAQFQISVNASAGLFASGWTSEIVPYGTPICSPLIPPTVSAGSYKYTIYVYNSSSVLCATITGNPLDPYIVIPAAACLGPAPAHPIDIFTNVKPRPSRFDLIDERVASPVTDVVRYGGTFWAADSARWEAVRDSMWTFDSGVGSSFSPAAPGKPPGYHTTMEGWHGVDLTGSTAPPYFRRQTTCVLNGSYSLWAGVSLAEANALCYSSGRGYGNNWNLVVGKTFACSGVGCLILEYRYHVEAEPGFDYLFTAVDTTGTGAAPDVVIAAYTGADDGTASFQLNPGMTMRSTPGDIVVKFIARSDGAYSDEDGGFKTNCGLAVLDDVRLSGDFSNFESGLNGWAQMTPVSAGVGDFSNLAALTDLPPPATVCPCGLADSVLVFFDPTEQHPLDQDNIAVSPWIDLKRGGDAGRPGKVILYDVYAELPLANYVFLQFQARWYPTICGATGLVTRSPFRSFGPIGYFGETPFCSGAGQVSVEDISCDVDAYAEQVQIGVGVVNLCRAEMFGDLCSGVSNTTPWLDNVAFGVYGSASRPIVAMTHFDDFQDAFATDGTLNPASPGRLDISFVRHGDPPGAGTSLGDTLVACGDGGNTEVRLVFHVRPGPFTNAAALAARAAEWTPEPSIGPGWYSARMDTAEVGGQAFRGRWMSTFHEADPGFAGTDRTADPQDPFELENEILPDHVLSPGSRIDYFVKARYLPPDPRNPGGADQWCVFPDTTGRRYREVEILPSSMAADTTWNCTLYVDHHDDRDVAEQALEEQGLTASLGVGGNNFEGTRFDRYDVRSPASGQVSFGRPIHTGYGCSVVQAFAYKNIAWHSGNLSTLQLTDEDANILRPWLTLRGIGNNRFWGSGDGLATSMHSSGEPSTVSFLNILLGVTRRCDTIRNVNCPTGSAFDSTFCQPTSPVAGSAFATTTPTSYRGNGCPDYRSFDLLGVNGAVPSARGQLNFVKNGVNTGFASVTNHNTVDVDYKTVLDGAAVGRARTAPANAHIPVQCTVGGASTTRADNVLDWFATAILCRIPEGSLVDVPEGTPKPPQFRAALGNAYPNPMNPTTRIQFTNGTENGRVTIEIFDLTGRLVKTLVDKVLSAGPHEVVWDGTNQSGLSSPSGMYFYKMTGDRGAYVTSKKLILMK